MNQQQLAAHLNLTTRRVRQLEAAGVIIAEDRGRYDPDLNQERYSIFLAKDQNPLLAEMERLCARIEPARKRLINKFDLRSAQKLAVDVMALDRVWSLSIAMRPETEQPLMHIVRKTAIDSTMAEIISTVTENSTHEQIQAAAHAA